MFECKYGPKIIKKNPIKKNPEVELDCGKRQNRPKTRFDQYISGQYQKES